MRLLIFADLHHQREVARDLVARAREVDVVVGAGDFACVHRGLQQTIDILAAIEKPTVLVSGNNENLEELRAACAVWPAAHVLHGEPLDIDGVPFFGLGGGVPVTPFGAWSFDLDEDEAGALLEACPRGAVLVTHSPPHGVLDAHDDGRPLGSTAIHAAIERTAPRLVVCGHIHAHAGQTVYIHATPVINPGPTGQVVEVVGKG